MTEKSVEVLFFGFSFSHVEELTGFRAEKTIYSLIASALIFIETGN